MICAFVAFGLPTTSALAPDTLPLHIPNMSHLQPLQATSESTIGKLAVLVQRQPDGFICGDNEYARFIYMRESGCRTTARNGSGCFGIGQACPASKIAHCGADYTCQNAWFTNYANQRYGGWAGAYAKWLRSHWW